MDGLYKTAILARFGSGERLRRALREVELSRDGLFQRATRDEREPFRGLDRC